MGTDDIFKKQKKEKISKNRTIKEVKWLIVCEGERTEPNYFYGLENFYKNKFKNIPMKFQVEGLGENTVSLVNKAIKIVDKSSVKYEKVFVVFDKDSFSKESFHQAIDLCNQNKFFPIWSNECFEIWYMLHFDFHQAKLSRNKYSYILSNKLGFKYTKNNEKMFSVLADKMSFAFENCNKLSNIHNGSTPSDSNQFSNMNIFIEEFDRNIKQFCGKNIF